MTSLRRATLERKRSRTSGGEDESSVVDTHDEKSVAHLPREGPTRSTQTWSQRQAHQLQLSHDWRRAQTFSADARKVVAEDHFKNGWVKVWSCYELP
jgi:hypothetical protein